MSKAPQKKTIETTVRYLESIGLTVHGPVAKFSDRFATVQDVNGGTEPYGVEDVLRWRSHVARGSAIVIHWDASNQAAVIPAGEYYAEELCQRST